MPTVEADVAFGLGKYSLTREEVKFRVSRALDAVGMLNYQQVDYAHIRLLCSNEPSILSVRVHNKRFLHFSEVNSNT